MTGRTWNLFEVGARQSPEFQHLAKWLDEHPGIGDRQHLPKFTTGLRLEMFTDHPDLVVIWQSYSDEYAPEQIQRLFACWPLARVVCIYGAWCAADGRTRSVWPPRFRVSVEQARQRLELEGQTLSGVTVPACPWTAAVDEVWRWHQESAPDVDLTGLRIALHIPDLILRESFQAELTAARAVVVDEAGATADAIIIDVEPWTSSLQPKVVALRSQFPSSMLLGFSGWVTPDLLACWQDLGIHDVLSKTAPETWRQVVFESTTRSPVRRTLKTACDR